MTETEIIIVDSVPEQEYQRLLLRALDYALLSIPFTLDRMSLKNPEKQIINIIKGKLAEGLLWFFFKHNFIPADFASCSTPFYQTDKRDFLLNGFEWDQKNNFIYHQGSLLADHAYIDLPALIPNRHPKDQWTKRLDKNFEQSRGVNYLFTFLKGADLREGQRDEPFFSIALAKEQKNTLQKMSEKYAGLTQDKEPFDGKAFKEYFYGIKSVREILQIRQKPSLVITAYADKRHWHLFKNTNHATFLNGTLRTKITNATCLIKELPSFLSLFSHLKKNLHFAKILNR